jgi:adenylate cyclase
VNVAARIESTTRHTGDTILISGRTLELLDDGSVQVEERTDVVLKGKSGAVSLFAVQPSLSQPS